MQFKEIATHILVLHQVTLVMTQLQTHLGQYWNALTQGAETNVLTTAGDLLVQGGSGASRLPVGVAGSVLAVSDSGYPEWQSNNVSDPVYYVTEEGSDTNSGENISNSFATLGKALSVVTAMQQFT